MKLFIGMSATETNDKISLMRRWTLYIAVLVIQISIVVHMFCNTENIVSTYTKGNYSSALHWNFLIDALNFAVYVIGIYTAFIFMMT